MSRFLNLTAAGWRGLALIFYALGLMSKPMVVTLPFVLLLLDVWPLRRVQALNGKAWPPLLLEKLPLIALSGIGSVVTLLVQRKAGAMGFFQHLTLGDRLGNAVESYLRYLGKLVWPTKLAIVYPHPAHDYFLNDGWSGWQLAAGAVALALISVWCVLRLARQPYLAVGWFWFLGTLTPVIGLVQAGEQAMANRYTYLPLIGPAISLVWGLVDVRVFLFRRREISPSCQPPAAIRPGTEASSGSKSTGGAAAAAVLCIGGLVWLTHLQLRHWRDTISLFDYAIAVTPDNPSAQFALGSGLEKAGEIRWAAVQYRIALAIEPKYSKANYNLGQIFAKAGDIREAAIHFEAALGSRPDDLPSRLNLAHCLQRLGRAQEAVAHYEASLRRDAGSIEALNNLAWLLATDPDPQLRNGRRAVELAERAVALSESKFPVMIGTLAAAYAEAGRFADAIAAAEKAVAVADALNLPEVAGRNRALMEIYRSQRAYHEPPR